MRIEINHGVDAPHPADRRFNESDSHIQRAEPTLNKGRGWHTPRLYRVAIHDARSSASDIDDGMFLGSFTS